MNLDLTAKIALVTGGARGIGRQCCLGLAQAGAEVIINCHTSKEKAEELKQAIKQQGHRAQVFPADISDQDEVVALFDFLRKKIKRLDILVNNAGIVRDSLLLSMEVSDWDSVHRIDLRGAFLCSKMAVEMMLPNHSGSIINIASVSAIRGGQGQTNYAAAKGGLISFTRACAVELAGKGIRVNAILPGIVSTEMSARIRRRGGDKVLERIPAGRFGEPADVANLVVFLASDKANYITGQAISVDGGLGIS